MIVGLLSTEGREGNGLMFILEPGNLVKLQLGQPIVKNLRDFLPDGPNLDLIITYTPDVVWVGEQLRQGKDLATTITDSIHRPEVFERTLDPEALTRAEIKAKE